MSKSPLNFGMMPAVGNLMNPFGGNMFGSGGAHQYVAQQIQQQQQQQQAAAQAQAAMQDPNNASASGFSSQSALFPTAQEATGAPTADYTGQGYATNRFGGFAGPTGGGVLTAGMAVGNAPIATAGNFNPQTQLAASKMFGNGTQFVKPKQLINL